jgi:hypothetical protein
MKRIMQSLLKYFCELLNVQYLKRAFVNFALKIKN